MEKIDLRSCSDAEFDELVATLDAEALQDTIAGLHAEMSSEQQDFNELNSRMLEAKQGSSVSDQDEYRRLSQLAVASQSRLTSLMSRNMRCFSQQASVSSSAPAQNTKGWSYKPKEVTIVPKPSADETNKPPGQYSSAPLAPQASRLTRVPSLPSGPPPPLPDQPPPVMNSEEQNKRHDDSLNDTSHFQMRLAASTVTSPRILAVTPSSSRGGSTSVRQDAFATNTSNQNASSVLGDAPSADLSCLTIRGLADSNNSIVSTGTDSTTASEQPVEAVQIRKITRLQAWPPEQPGKQQQVSQTTTTRANKPVTESVTDRKTHPGANMDIEIIDLPVDNTTTSPKSENIRVNSSIIDSRHVKFDPSLTAPGRRSPLNINSISLTPSTSQQNGLQHTQPRATNSMHATHGSSVQPCSSAGATSLYNGMVSSRNGPESLPLANEVDLNLSQSIEYEMEEPESSASKLIGHDGSEKVQHRITMKGWSPKKLLDALYKVELQTEECADLSSHYVHMEGYVQRLPPNKRKGTLLKTWKRRYCRTKNGSVLMYESKQSKDPCEVFQLMGGSVEDLGNKLIGFDDGRGRYMVIRLSTPREHENWREALETHVIDNIKATYIQPVLRHVPHTTKKVVVIDLGSSAVRAGILHSEPSLPYLYMPNIAAVHKSSGKTIFGADAYHPGVRSQSRLVYPLRVSPTVQKSKIDKQLLAGLLERIFDLLNVEPAKYYVMLSTPQNPSLQMKQDLCSVLFGQFSVRGIHMAQQSVLAMYLYSSSTGIMLDVGDRLQVFPISDGYILETGQTVQMYGGRRTADALNSMLAENKFHFFTAVEYLIVQYIMQKTCFLSLDYAEDVKACTERPSEFLQRSDLREFDVPRGTWISVHHDVSRFKATEGLFKPEVWGMDNPGVAKLVHRAIQSCPMDSRREMARQIYLAGGGTMFPGFPERLQLELERLLPSSVLVQVHASANRLHAAYIGATVVANTTGFEQICVSLSDWQQLGTRVLQVDYR